MMKRSVKVQLILFVVITLVGISYVSAEYVGYLPHRYLIVKKTGSTITPFIGILTYFEQTLQCVGKTREEALQGPWHQINTRQVSEIFRFTKGKWEY